ncbi:hypothetical protein [Burkholderia mayonis]|uniref:hypothetical protein n=1 Tax=Burkholderia mayonis TaxID=1385591 RepID=UPI00139691D5|nr:hypothetical protein [Burkholderia mayonis]
MPINKAERDRGERVLPNVHFQLTNAGAFPALRAGLFRGDDFSLVTVQSIRARDFLGWRTLNESATDHFIFGAPSPILCVVFRAECVGGRGTTNVPEGGFPGSSPEGAVRPWCSFREVCTEFAPRGAGQRKGLADNPQSP